MISDTRNKFCDKFSIVIAHLKKHNYLQELSQGYLYKDLDSLCKLRNRIHIQDVKKGSDKDEYKIWIEKNMDLATKTLVRICEVLSQCYPRAGTSLLSMADFPKPWE